MADPLSLVQSTCDQLRTVVEMDPDESCTEPQEVDISAALERLFVALTTEPRDFELILGRFLVGFYGFAQDTKRRSTDPLLADAVFRDLVRLCESVIALLQSALSTSAAPALFPLLSAALEHAHCLAHPDLKVTPARRISPLAKL